MIRFLALLCFAPSHPAHPALLAVNRHEDVVGKTADFERCGIARKNFVVVSDRQTGCDMALPGRGEQEARGPAKKVRCIF